MESIPSKDRTMHEVDNLSYLDQFITFTFFDRSIHIHIRISIQETKYFETAL